MDIHVRRIAMKRCRKIYGAGGLAGTETPAATAGQDSRHVLKRQLSDVESGSY